MIILTNRCMEILKVLVKQDKGITVGEISKKLHVSERTLRYDLKLIKSWLEENQTSLLSIPKKGICLEDKPKVCKLLESYKEGMIGKNLVLSSEERIRIIMELLLINPSGIKTKEIVEQLYVSRSTVIKDLKQAERWFQAKNIELIRNQKNGLVLHATEPQIRNAAVNYLVDHAEGYFLLKGNGNTDADMWESALSSGCFILNTISEKEDFNTILCALEKILAHFHVKLSDNSFMSVFYYISFSLFRISAGCYVRMSAEQQREVRQYPEYCYISEIFYPIIFEYNLPANLIDDEIGFIVLYIVSANKIKNEGVNEYESDTVNEILFLLIQTIEKKMHLRFSADSEMFENLRVHLGFALMRAKFGIKQVNPMLPEIKKSFKSTFLLCREVVRKIEDERGIFFDDNETGYLAVYMEAAIKNAYGQRGQFVLRAALVCAQGIATVKLMETMIEREFPNIKIVSKISVLEIRNYDFSGLDIILSTVDIPFPLVRPILKVNPILTKLDIRKIDSFICKQIFRDEMIIEENALIEIIDANCSIQNREKLKRELKGLMKKNLSGKGRSRELPSLTEILPEKNFAAKVEAEDWTQAVTKSTEILVQNKMTKREYIDDIISMRDKYNQYSVIAPGICMPHAAPYPENRLAISLMTLKNPVHIEYGQVIISVSVVMTLSTIDTESHGRALDELLSLVENNPDFVQQLSCAENTSDLIRVFYQYYDKTF